METYNGHVKTPADAIVLFEACRLGHLPRVQRRLSEKERQLIKSGSVFVWDEREAGMRRWTDGKSWSASRVSGSFLTYREMEGKRGGGSTFSSPQINAAKRNANGSMKDDSGYNHSDMDTTMGEDGPEAYRYKPDGLVKQSFSITTSSGQHLHLISYYARSHPGAPNLPQPTSDPNLRHIRPAKGMYPETTVQDGHHIPPVTRSPMMGSPYAGSPSAMAAHGPGYPRHNAAFQHPLGGLPSYGYMGPPSPMQTTPQPQHYYPFANGGHRGPPSATSSPVYYPQPPGYHNHPRPPPGPTAFDRAPPPMSGSGLPPPPLPHPNSYNSYPPQQYQPPPNYQHGHPHPFQAPPLPPQSYTSSPTASHHAGSSAQDHYRPPYRTSSPGPTKIDPRLASAPHQPLNAYHRNEIPRSTLPNDGHRPPNSNDSDPQPTKMIPSIGSLINTTPPPPTLTSGGKKDMPGDTHEVLDKPIYDTDKRALRQLDRAFVP